MQQHGTDIELLLPLWEEVQVQEFISLLMVEKRGKNYIKVFLMIEILMVMVKLMKMIYPLLIWVK